MTEKGQEMDAVVVVIVGAIVAIFLVRERTEMTARMLSITLWMILMLSGMFTVLLGGLWLFGPTQWIVFTTAAFVFLFLHAMKRWLPESWRGTGSDDVDELLVAILGTLAAIAGLALWSVFLAGQSPRIPSSDRVVGLWRYFSVWMIVLGLLYAFYRACLLWIHAHGDRQASKSAETDDSAPRRE